MAVTEEAKDYFGSGRAPPCCATDSRASALGMCLDPVTGKVSRLYKIPLGLVLYILKYMKEA